MVTKARHIFCLALEATLNWQSSEHQTVNSCLVSEGLCSHMHPLPAIVTSSNKGRLFNENFFLFQWLFHLFCNWHKIAHGLSLLRSSISYSLKLSSASILSLKIHTSLPYLLCNLLSSWHFPIPYFLQLSPSSLISVSLPWVPVCPPLSNCGYASSAQPLAILQWSYPLPDPHNLLFVVNSQTNIPTHPLPQPCPTEHRYLKVPRFQQMQCFRTHYLRYSHQTRVVFSFVDCLSISPLPRAETLASYWLNSLDFCLRWLSITKFCEFFYVFAQTLSSHLY